MTELSNVLSQQHFHYHLGAIKPNQTEFFILEGNRGIVQLKRLPTKEQLWHSCCNKTNYNSQRIFKLFPSYLHYTEQLKRY